MQVTHPATALGSIPPEDIFIATDDMGMQVGRGYTVYQYQPHLYPDCPVNIYFSLECRESGRYVVFGALMARARQLRDMNPGVQARVYTCVTPQEAVALDFYEHSGMACDEREVVVRMPVPAGEGRLPMSSAIQATPLNTPMEREALLQRLRQNDITHVDMSVLTQAMAAPHFHSLGLILSGRLAGEALLAGYGNECELLAIYVSADTRRRGIGHALLHRCMAVMGTEGVGSVTARFVTRSLPQQALATSFGAVELGTTAIFPGLFL